MDMANKEWPVEFHCHGVHTFDFSAFEHLDLRALNQHMTVEQSLCVPTIYLPRDRLLLFTAFMREYAALAKDGQLPNIPGFAVEGPLLSSFGGTPRGGVWQPTRAEWSQLCGCGPLGLKYVVISPDFATPRSGLADGRTTFGLEWAIEQLLASGISPALGHFLKSDPHGSASCVAQILDLSIQVRPSVPVITDHLFNDMPLAFRHAWRGATERARRDEELGAALRTPWELDNLDLTVGIVPATLIRAALDGRLTLCLNFDGEHVDLAYCRRMIDLVGVTSIILMTDRTDTRVLAGQSLHKISTSSLWYQGDNVVAAGSTPISRQVANLRSIGVDEASIQTLTSSNPRLALGV